MATMDAPTRDQSPTDPPLPSLPKATLPLWELVPAEHQHYFNHQPARFYRRSFEFGSSPYLLPLARAFLNTSAAGLGDDYQYVFTLLGSELATNALQHSGSGRPGGRYTLTCQRFHNGLYLACTDGGSGSEVVDVDHLTHLPEGLCLEVESGRGLAMVDLLATTWADNGCTATRQVWFFLDFHLNGSRWNTL